MSSQSDAMCFFSCVQAISCMLSLEDLFTCHALRCTLCLTAAFSVTMLLLRFTGNASCFGLAYTCLHFILTHCKSELLIRLTITDKTCLELGICNRDGEGRGFYHVIICTDQFFLRWGGNHLSLIHVIKWQGGSIDYKIKSIRGQKTKKTRKIDAPLKICLFSFLNYLMKKYCNTRLFLMILACTVFLFE